MIERGLEGVGTSPGVGEVASSSGGIGEATELGVIEPVSSSPSNLSPSSGEPSSPPSPGKEYFRYSMRERYDRARASI